MSCAYTRPRYQVSCYRTIGPLVSFCNFTTILFISLWGEGMAVHCIVSSCSLFNVLYNNRFAWQTSGL